MRKRWGNAIKSPGEEGKAKGEEIKPDAANKGRLEAGTCFGARLLRGDARARGCGFRNSMIFPVKLCIFSHKIETCYATKWISDEEIFL